MKIITVFLLFVSYSLCFHCETDADCNNQGTCQSDGTCYCKWFYEGEECTQRWADVNHGWLGFWIFYCVWTCVLHLVLIAIMANQLRGMKRIRVNMVTIVLGVLFLSSLSTQFQYSTLTLTVRLIDYSVDAHNYSGRITAGVDNTFYYVPVLGWFFCYYLMMMYWIKVGQDSNLMGGTNFKKMNIYILCMEIATVVVLLPAIVWESITPIPASVYFLEISVIFFIINCIVLSLYAALKEMTFDTKLYWMLLLKTKYVIAIAVPMGAFIITLLVFAVEDTTTKPWTYVILHTLLRTEEAGLIFCMLQIVNRRPLFRPDYIHTESSTKENSEATSVALQTIQSSST